MEVQTLQVVVLMKYPWQHDQPLIPPYISMARDPTKYDKLFVSEYLLMCVPVYKRILTLMAFNGL